MPFNFYCAEKETVSIGDCIVMNYGNEGFSAFTITEVLEVRKGAMSNKNYILTMAVWSNFVDEKESFDYSKISNRMRDFYNLPKLMEA